MATPSPVKSEARRLFTAFESNTPSLSARSTPSDTDSNMDLTRVPIDAALDRLRQSAQHAAGDLTQQAVSAVYDHYQFLYDMLVEQNGGWPSIGLVDELIDEETTTVLREQLFTCVEIAEDARKATEALLKMPEGRKQTWHARFLDVLGIFDLGRRGWQGGVPKALTREATQGARAEDVLPALWEVAKERVAKREQSNKAKGRYLDKDIPAWKPGDVTAAMAKLKAGKSTSAQSPALHAFAENTPPTSASDAEDDADSVGESIALMEKKEDCPPLTPSQTSAILPLFTAKVKSGETRQLPTPTNSTLRRSVAAAGQKRKKSALSISSHVSGSPAPSPERALKKPSLEILSSPETPRHSHLSSNTPSGESVFPEPSLLPDSTNLSLDTMQRLAPNGMLSSEIIYCLLDIFTPPSWYVVDPAVHDWGGDTPFRRYFSDQHDHLVLPIHLPAHWVVVYLDPQSGLCTVVDPARMASLCTEIETKTRRFISRLAEWKVDCKFIHNPPHTPRQTDTTSCGVVVALDVLFRTCGTPPPDNFSISVVRVAFAKALRYRYPHLPQLRSPNPDHWVDCNRPQVPLLKPPTTNSAAALRQHIQDGARVLQRHTIAVRAFSTDLSQHINTSDTLQRAFESASPGIQNVDKFKIEAYLKEIEDSAIRYQGMSTVERRILAAGGLVPADEPAEVRRKVGKARTAIVRQLAQSEMCGMMAKEMKGFGERLRGVMKEVDGELEDGEDVDDEGDGEDVGL